MQRAVHIGFAVVTGAIVCSCSPADGPPSPPKPPDVAARMYSKPPGSDDFANGNFPYPLSLTDAEAVLRRTGVFAFGGMPAKRQVQAFNVVFQQADAASRFRSIGESDSPAGRLYALAGLLLLDRGAANRLQGSLSADSQTILVLDSDVVYKKPIRELAAMVDRRDMGTSFRRVRDETNVYFAKPR